MNGRATSTAEVTSWDESTIEEFEETGKLTRATVPQIFSGDLEGEGVMEFLMCYPPDSGGTASFIGQQRVAGTLAGRKGSFVSHGAGVFVGGEARWTWSAVPGSATGELAGLSGEGTSVASGGMKISVTFDYRLP
jgi:hypothetical protein